MDALSEEEQEELHCMQKIVIQAEIEGEKPTHQFLVGGHSNSWVLHGYFAWVDDLTILYQMRYLPAWFPGAGF
jgi:hypothetical protein